MITFARKLRVATKIARARRLASRGRLADSQNLLRSLFATYGSKGPNSGSPILANLLAADIHQRMGELDESVKACRIVAEQAGTGRFVDGPSFSTNDVRYLLVQCSWILSHTSRETGSESFTLAKQLGSNINQIDLNHVKPLLRRLFPMTEAEALALERFFKAN